MTRHKTARQDLSPAKKRLFAAVTAATPVLFFVLLELGLRLFHYGPDLSLFTLHDIRRQPYALINPDVKFRYFGSSPFSPATAPDYFPVPKPKGVFRIFCLGGSTTVGFPYLSNGAFPTFLRDRLSALFPRKKIEVINLGMTAVNSYTVLDMVRELPAYEPDLLVDYDGHNEFYGALGVASNQTVGSKRAITLLYLRLVHLRTFQLLRDALSAALRLFGHGTAPESRGTMMETLAQGRYIPSGSPLYNDAYAVFRNNMADIREICRRHRIPLVVGTQVSDLRDQPPFVSVHAGALSSEDLRRFTDDYAAANDLQERHAWDSAATRYRRAVAMDSLYAGAHYRLAQCLEAEGNKEGALEEYIRARDTDALRFRTDSKFNDLIRAMGDDRGCFVADIEARFKALSPDSLIGHPLIEEHLHPDAQGQFAIARAYARVMREQGLLASREEWDSAGTVNEDSLWAGRSMSALDERIAQQNVALLTSGWPFRDHVPVIPSVAADDTLGRIALQVVTLKLNWREGHEEAITYYQTRREWSDVIEEYRTLISQDPLNLELYFDLAKVCLRDHRYDAMAGALKRSINVYPTLQAYRTLGDILLQKGDAAGSLAYYLKTDDFAQGDQERLQNGYAIAFAYAESGDLSRAEDRLLAILKSQPQYQPARVLLADVRRRQGRTQASP